MKKALIVYHSHTGTTKKFAERIAGYLEQKQVECKVTDTSGCTNEMIQWADCLLLGCWTSGLFFFLQGPEIVWKKFAAQLPDLSEKHVGLFTTYKIATGSMFKNMRKSLGAKATSKLELRSRNGELNPNHSLLLEAFVAQV